MTETGKGNETKILTQTHAPTANQKTPDKPTGLRQRLG